MKVTRLISVAVSIFLGVSALGHEGTAPVTAPVIRQTLAVATQPPKVISDAKGLQIFEKYCVECHSKTTADPDNGIPVFEGFMALKGDAKTHALNEMLKHMSRHIDERKPMPPLDHPLRSEFETPRAPDQTSDKQDLIAWLISQGGEIKDPFYKR